MDSVSFDVNFTVPRYVVSDISQKSQKITQTMEA